MLRPSHAVGGLEAASTATTGAASRLSADKRALQEKLQAWARNWESLALLHERGRGPLRLILAQWCRQQAEHAMYAVTEVETGSGLEAARYLRQAPRIQQALNRLWTIGTEPTPVLDIFLRNRSAFHRALMSLVMQTSSIQVNAGLFDHVRELADRLDDAESSDVGMMILNELAYRLRLTPISADGPFWRPEDLLKKLVATFVHGADDPPLPAPLRVAMPSPRARPIALPPSSPAHPGSGGPPPHVHR
jgi:hypothetical protein